MKKFVPMLLTGGVIASIAGCATEADPVSAEVSQTPAVAPAVSKTAEGVLVSLSVPNMTRGSCAASERSDLTKIDGIIDIQTDTGNQVCSFRVTNPTLDYKAKLNEYAKTNTHLKGFSIQ